MNKQRQTSWISAVLQKHPALMVSALYVVASMVGMLFSWDYLRHFGINVFNFAQIGDFLLASLERTDDLGARRACRIPSHTR